ncbi:unnamed protein product, partial [Polarella glacialis]
VALQHDRILDNHHVTDGRSFFVALEKNVKPRRGALSREEIVNGLRRLDVAVDDSQFNMLVTTKDENQKGFIELDGFLLALNRAAGTVGAATQATGTSEGTATPAVTAAAAGAQQCYQGFLNLDQSSRLAKSKTLMQLLAVAANPQQAAAQSQQVGKTQTPQQTAAKHTVMRSTSIAASPAQQPAQVQNNLSHSASFNQESFRPEGSSHPDAQLATKKGKPSGHGTSRANSASRYLAAIAGNPKQAAAQSQQVGTYQNPQRLAAAGFLAPTAGNPELVAAQSQQVGTDQNPQQAAAAGNLVAIAGNPELAAGQSQQVGTYPHPQQTAAAGYLAAAAGNSQLAALNRAAGTVGTATQATGTSEGTATPAVAAAAAGALQCYQGFLNLYRLLAAAGNWQQAAAQSQQVGTYQNPQQAAAAGYLAPTAGNPELAAAQSQQVGTYQNPQHAAASGYLAATAGNPQLAAGQSQQVGTYSHPQQTAASGYLAAIAGKPQQAAAQSQQVGNTQNPQQTEAKHTVMRSTSIAASPRQYQPAQVQNNLSHSASFNQEPSHQEGSSHPDPQLVLAKKKGKPSGHGTSRANSASRYLAAIAGNPKQAAAQSQQVGTYQNPQRLAAAGFLAPTAGNPELAAAQTQQVGTDQNPQQAAAAGNLAAIDGNLQLAAGQSQQVGTYQNPQQAAAAGYLVAAAGNPQLAAAQPKQVGTYSHPQQAAAAAGYLAAAAGNPQLEAGQSQQVGTYSHPQQAAPHHQVARSTSMVMTHPMQPSASHVQYESAQVQDNLSHNASFDQESFSQEVSNHPDSYQEGSNHPDSQAKPASHGTSRANSKIPKVPRRGALTREEIVNGLRRLDVAVDDSQFNMLVTTKDENQKGFIELDGFLLALNRAAGTVGAATQATGTSEGTATPAVTAAAAGAQQCYQGFLNLDQSSRLAKSKTRFRFRTTSPTAQVQNNLSHSASVNQESFHPEGSSHPDAQLATKKGKPSGHGTSRANSASRYLAAIAGNPKQAAAQSQQVGTYQNPQQAAAAGYLAPTAGNPELAAAQSQQVGTNQNPQQAAASGYLAATAGNPQLAAGQSQQVGTYSHPQQTAASGYLAAIAGKPQLVAAQSQQAGTYPHSQQAAAAGYLAAVAGNPELAAAQSQQVGTYQNPQRLAAAGFLVATAGNPQLAAAQPKQVGTYSHPQQAAAAAGYLAAAAGNPQLEAGQSQQVGTYPPPQQTPPPNQVTRTTSMVSTHPMQPSASHVQYESAQVQDNLSHNASFDQESFSQEVSNHPDSYQEGSNHPDSCEPRHIACQL